jgi:hypothetical protein
MAETSQNVQTLYDSGTKIFTKATLEEYADQLDRFRQGFEVKLRITGIDGVVVDSPEPLTWLAPYIDLLNPDIECVSYVTSSYCYDSLL